MILDKLINAIAGLGTGREKATHNVREFVPMQPSDLLNCYRDSRLAANIVDMPARDATKKGRQWNAQPDEISKLEAEEKRLNLTGKLMELIQTARLVGGAYLYLATGEDPMTPLVPENHGVGSLRFLTLFDKTVVSGENERVRDPESEWFNRYEWYRIQTGDGTPFVVHASRLVHLRGVGVPYVHAAPTAHHDGDSVLNSMMEAVNGVDSTFANMVAMVFEGKIDVLKIPDLMARVSGADHANFEAALNRRLATFSMSKGIHGLGVIDANEEFDSKNMSYAGVADMATLIMQYLSGLAGVPMTKLFGMSPAGLNATGEYDDVNYKDWIKTFQTMDLDPACSRLFEMLIRSALGDRPEEVHYTWRDISAPKPKDVAEIGDKLGQLLDRIVKSNLYPEEVMAQVVVNTMTEYAILPGFESAVLQWFEDNGVKPGDPEAYAKLVEEAGPDEAELLEAGGNPAPGQPATGAKRPVADMAPRPLYVSRKVLNGEEILEHYRAQGIDGLYPADELHVTIIYSRDAVDWIKMGSAWDEELTVNAGGPRVMALFGTHLVLQFAHSELQWRNYGMRESGASYDHDEYLPHVSIAGDYQPLAGTDVERDVQPYRGRILLGPEIFEDVKNDR